MIILLIFLGFCLFFLLLMSLFNKMKKADKIGLKEKVYVSIISGLFMTLLASQGVFEHYHKKELIEKKNALDNNGYRYTKSISDDEKMEIRSNQADYFLEICGNNEYKILDDEYEDIRTNSHLFKEKSVYIYCRDFNIHKNIVLSVNLDNYDFSAKFPEYPSSQAILEFCDLDNAVIVDRELNSLNPNEVFFHNKIDAYLYCKT